MGPWSGANVGPDLDRVMTNTRREIKLSDMTRRKHRAETVVTMSRLINDGGLHTIRRRAPKTQRGEREMEQVQPSRRNSTVGRLDQCETIRNRKAALPKHSDRGIVCNLR
jgi:hypothetical protein